MMQAHLQRGFQAVWEKGFRSFRIIACVDEDKERAEATAETIGKWQECKPQIFKTTEEMLRQEKAVQAVDIAVPHYLHHTIALACLSEGKNVLIEKPLAITLRAGRAMIEEAEKRQLILSVAENYRRDWSSRAFRWTIEQGKIGKPQKIYWLDIYERRHFWGWRDDRERSGGGWLLDGGVHFADLMRYFLGEVDEVFGQTALQEPRRFDRTSGQQVASATIEDVAHALLTFQNGVLGIWAEVISAPGAPVSRRIIYGDEGCIDLKEGLFLRDKGRVSSVEDLKKEFVVSLTSEQREQFFPLGITDDVAQEVYEFLKACQTGDRKVEVDGWEGYRSQAVCMAVYESAVLHQPVKIRDIEAHRIEVYQSDLNRRWAIS